MNRKCSGCAQNPRDPWDFNTDPPFLLKASVIMHYQYAPTKSDCFFFVILDFTLIMKQCVSSFKISTSNNITHAHKTLNCNVQNGPLIVHHGDNVYHQQVLGIRADQHLTPISTKQKGQQRMMGNGHFSLQVFGHKPQYGTSWNLTRWFTTNIRGFCLIPLGPCMFYWHSN